jgi:8-amino-7-oxononanoate synthase
MPAVLPSSAYARLCAELEDELAALEAQGLRRRLATVEGIDGPCVRVGGRLLVNWCSNDYLGLAGHPDLAEAAAAAAAEWGVGARASRLLAGTSVWHARLEAALAAWFGAEAALVFPSGYQANLGVLAALLSSGDAVFVDRLAHASLVDAARATGAALRAFRHNDVEQLRAALARAPRARRRLIVSEGIFSMDGDAAPLPALLEAAEAHDAVVYLDDAHGAFVAGATGRGSPEAAGVPHERLVYVGTLGKALGCQGGFVAGPRALIERLLNRARTFLYTTALAIPVAAAALAALRLVEQEPERRTALQASAQRLHRHLVSFGASSSACSHIQPVIFGSARAALAAADRLLARGCWAPAIRPPTVPARTARLRLSLTALHTPAQIDELADALRAVLHAGQPA